MGRVEANFRSRNIRLSCSVLDASGLTHTCLVLKSWHNFEGRYYQGGANAQDAIDGTSAISRLWGTPASYGTALQLPSIAANMARPTP